MQERLASRVAVATAHFSTVVALFTLTARSSARSSLIRPAAKPLFVSG